MLTVYRLPLTIYDLNDLNGFNDLNDLLFTVHRLLLTERSALRAMLFAEY
ncbi:MAG: hypothetical protein P8075_04225 [Deltaproteobacteria bacterium]|jgi:hypothetical protein